MGSVVVWLSYALWLCRAQPIQDLSALLIIAILFEKALQIEALFEMDRVFRHDGNPCAFRQFHYSGTSAHWLSLWGSQEPVGVLFFVFPAALLAACWRVLVSNATLINDIVVMQYKLLQTW